MLAPVPGSLVEAHARHEARGVGAELQADCTAPRSDDDGRPESRPRPDAAAREPVAAFTVTASAPSARSRCRRSPGPGSSPGPASTGVQGYNHVLRRRGVPRCPGVGRDLDRARCAADVARGPDEHDRRSRPSRRAGCRRRDGRRGRGRVGRLRGRDEAGHQRRGLGAEVGEHVDGRLLHPDVGGRTALVVLVVESPGPLHGARTEHERAARGAVHREVVRRGAVAVLRSEVEQVLAVGDVDGGARQVERPGRPGRVVGGFVPLEAERRRCERRDRRRAPVTRCSCCARTASCRRPRGPGSRRPARR